MKTIEQLIQDEQKRKEYRERYNQRPEVKAKRAAYMKSRNEMKNLVFKMFKDGALEMAPTGGRRIDMGTGQVVEAEYTEVQ